MGGWVFARLLEFANSFSGPPLRGWLLWVQRAASAGPLRWSSLLRAPNLSAHRYRAA